DTAHLPALREQLRARLTALGRLAWAEEEFTHLEELRWTGAPDGGGPDAFLRVKGAKALAPRQLAALRELYRWREALGAEQDRATFRIIGNDVLLAVAKALPRVPADLVGIAGLPPSLATRHGAALLDGTHRALALPESELPHVERAPRQARDPAVEARVERLKAVRNSAAAELGLDAGVLCGRSTLEGAEHAVGVVGDHRTRRAAGRGEGHLHTHLAADGLDVVHEAEVDDVHVELRILDLSQRGARRFWAERHGCCHQ